MRRIPLARLVAALLAVLTLPGTRATADEPLAFERDVRRILMTRCGKCHDGASAKGDLEVVSLSGLARGGESGEPAVAAVLEEGMLWTMIDGGDMPPEGEPALTDVERRTLRRWLETTAPAEIATASRITQHDVLPFLYTRCVTCHGGRRTEAELDLRTVASILRGGRSGPAVVPGRPEESLLLKKVTAKDMPPPKELIRAGVRPLEEAEIEAIREWIGQGAREYDVAPDVQTAEPDPLVTDEDRSFWAFQPPREAAVPVVEGRTQGAIDGFLLRELEERGLGYSPEASRGTLVRRVAFDLTGLPPRWEDLERFVADPSPRWYETMVDFYLASPRYGERWGRYWLDVAGYADSEGKRSADPIRPHAWRYRDYVIRSLNDDKPFDRFLLEQVAGDELYDFEHAEVVTPEMEDALVATGFLRMAPDGTGSDIVDTVEERFEVVADEIEILGSAVLGLTLRCAQCHDHKYDPLPQRDYYRLVATLQGAYDVYDWLKPTSVAGQSKQESPTRRYLSTVDTAERERWLSAKEEIEERVAALQREFDARPLEEREAKATRAAHDKAIKAIQDAIPPEPLVRALWDRGEPSPTWVFRRGQFDSPGRLVGPGVPSMLTDGRTPFVPEPIRPGSTGRRLQLGRWLTQPDHPLTARVFVNRVWSHHFGRGLVPTVANLGRTGEPPSHPELLDWLAVSFVENGWSQKWLHRAILTSAAYRQSSAFSEALDRADPDNRWLSRMPLRRLEAEAVRDGLLAVAGELDETPFGTPDQVTVRADGLVTTNRGEEGWRRTCYVLQRRKELPTILEAFDLPQMSPNCTDRPNSTVASQALLLLNNDWVRTLSESFAARIAAECGDDPGRRIERVYEIALARRPTAAERAALLETLELLESNWASVPAKEGNAPPSTRALANVCHVVMNSAEFLFVD